MNKQVIVSFIEKMIVFFCIGWLFGSLLFTILEAHKNKEANYILPVQIVAIDNEKQEVLCEDEDGNLWAFNGWIQEGETIQLKMATNGTEFIYDDSVIQILIEGR